MAALASSIAGRPGPRSVSWFPSSDQGPQSLATVFPGAPQSERSHRHAARYREIPSLHERCTFRQPRLHNDSLPFGEGWRSVGDAAFFSDPATRRGGHLARSTGKDSAAAYLAHRRSGVACAEASRATRRACSATKRVLRFVARSTWPRNVSSVVHPIQHNDRLNRDSKKKKTGKKKKKKKRKKKKKTKTLVTVDRETSPRACLINLLYSLRGAWRSLPFRATSRAHLRARPDANRRKARAFLSLRIAARPVDIPSIRALVPTPSPPVAEIERR